MRIPTLCLVLGAVLALPAHAETLDDPRSLALGGAVRGDPVGNSAVLYNPAGMSRAYTYAAEIGFFRADRDKHNATAINVVDSKTQPALAVGLAYAYEFSDDDAAVALKGHNGRLAFASAMVPGKIHAGLGLHYVKFERADPLEDLSGFSLDAGFLLSLTNEIHLGLAGQNILDLEDPMFPVLWGGGIAYTGDRFALDFDIAVDVSTDEEPHPRYMVGGEMLLAESVPVRAGFRRDEATGYDYVSGGLGFMSAGAGGGGSQFNIAFRHNLDRSGDIHFGVGMTMFM